jgi:hypothetical protein
VDHMQIPVRQSGLRLTIASMISHGVTDSDKLTIPSPLPARITAPFATDRFALNHAQRPIHLNVEARRIVIRVAGLKDRFDGYLAAIDAAAVGCSTAHFPNRFKSIFSNDFASAICTRTCSG